uniref:Uncharacterized protein n=1 Tax=mine drainage metagenome TaxID=410659 RepID=E6QMH9_9ZZZZ
MSGTVTEGCDSRYPKPYCKEYEEQNQYANTAYREDMAQRKPDSVGASHHSCDEPRGSLWIERI